MRKGEKKYEGKAKIIYASDQPGRFIVYFKDDATAFDGQKKAPLSGKA
jgi:phosphoribosylaminoimidazole-succinocarboxamide synthase